MRLPKARYYKKVSAALAVVMTFFLYSCGPQVTVREPIISEPIEEEAPERKVLEKETGEEALPVQEEVVDHFAIAEGYWAKKEYDKALAAYDNYLETVPLGERAREALARKAMIYYELSQYEEALPLLVGVVEDYPFEEERAALHLLLAKTYFQLKKYPELRRSSLEWLERYTDYPAKKKEIFLLLGQCAKELNERPRVLYWWLKVLESPAAVEEEKERIRSELLDLIYQAADEELQEMAVHAQESDLVFPIYYRLAVSFLFSNRLEEAREVAAEMEQRAPEGQWLMMAQGILEKIRQMLEVRPNVIGCLLPLSGPFALYGQEVLNGIEIGLDLFHEQDEFLASLQFLIRDTKGDPETAVGALQELAQDERAIGIIGPLISKVAVRVAEIAAELGVVNITLSQREGITGKGEMIFQNCLTPEDELRTLTAKVIGEIGLTRFAILYPANAYGTYFMNRFWDMAESRGATITAAEAYNPEDTDFEIPIRKMVGLFYPRPPSKSEELEQKEPDEKLEPIIDFDAVFIPDSYERVALIASQLAYHDVVGITLLGTNLWNSPELLEIGGKYVRGAIFPSGFFAGSGYIGVERFVEQYRNHFGKEPGLLAAIGYDTIRIIREILREKGEDMQTREDLRRALMERENFDGVTGPMLFDEERRAKRDPLLLTVSGRHFLPLP
jgi:ABC-type branched-subunit amino acid transport system substrate-binding protein